MNEASKFDGADNPVPIRLCLPGIDESGNVIGIWDESRGRWIDQKTKAVLYPSQWTEL